jgi:arylsulfatase A-like enzyme
MKKSYAVWDAALGLSLCAFATGAEEKPDSAPSLYAQGSKPNVLFISFDDMNDWTRALGGYAGTVYTPNMDRLGQMGIRFTNAHTPSPKCGPTRAAILTGYMPSTTGIYKNSQWWRPHMPDAVTLPAHFRANGYRVVGAGKVHHHTEGFNPPDQWDEFHPLERKDWLWYQDDSGRYRRAPRGVTLAKVSLIANEFDWGCIGRPEQEYEDYMLADKIIGFLSQSQDRPFFLAYGTWLPHMPLYVPQKYIDMYPLEEIVLPVVPEDDLDDIPEAYLALQRGAREWRYLKESGRWAEFVQHYLAAITFADAQLGRILDALEASPYADNTIIVCWSDHGYHLGEKGKILKTTLWERATRVPFYFVVPGGLRGEETHRPVNLIDLYPTLIDLCDLPSIDNLDGHSLVPLLENPQREWRPSVIEYLRGNSTVRTEDWRYIRYVDGSEELYDHRRDPNEWENLAGNPEYNPVKEELSRWATSEWAPMAPGKEAYLFDAKAYEWRCKETGRIVTGR